MNRPSITAASKWVFTGTVFSRSLQLVTSVMIARLLGPAGFGVFGLATSMAVTLSLVAGLGLGDASYKYLAEYYSKDQVKGRKVSAVIIWSATLLSTLVFSALWWLRPWWASVTFPDSATTSVVALCLILAWTNLMFALLAGVFSGLQRFRDLALLNVLQAFVVVTLAWVLSFYGAEGALLAYVLGAGVALIWGAARILQIDRKLFSFPRLRDFLELKSVLRFSGPIWVGAFALSPIVTLAFAFLAHQSNGEYHLGILNTANGLRSVVTILPGMLAVAITPALIQEGGLLGERSLYHQLLEKAFSALVFVTLPVLIVCLFLGDLVLLIYGKAYSDAFHLFLPLATSATIGAVGTPLIIAMMARNLTSWSLGFGITKSALLVALTFWWVPSQYSLGLAWALSVSEICFYVLALEFSVKVDAVPAKTRAVFYASIAASTGLLMLALIMPRSLRWPLAAPFSFFAMVYLIRANPHLRTWITNLFPTPLQAGAQRIFKLIAA